MTVSLLLLLVSLSTTKWIHLNFGDAGIKKFFDKVDAMLKPGGLFILEPQLWKSYKKRAALTPVSRSV